MRRLIIEGWYLFNRFFEILTPVVDLFLRIWIWRAFFLSGLAQLNNWESTLTTFQYEYSVPFLSPIVAANLAVIIELGISTLILIGLFGRLPTFILFIFNIMAVVSYPPLLQPDSFCALKDHIYWGIILMVLLTHGSGPLSVDEAIRQLFFRDDKDTKW